jgi:hypothetical protein
VTAFAHPGNPQRTWWHVRDYGLLSANAFGKRVLPPEADGKIVVKAGTALRLRYGTLFYNAPAGAAPNPKAAYAKYLEAAR